MSVPEVIFGAGNFGQYEGSPVSDKAEAQVMIDTLLKHGFHRIDTARRYPAQNSGTSELVLGQSDLSKVTIDTKVLSDPGCQTPAGLQKSVEDSLSLLGLEKVNTLYIHFPDSKTPFEDVCEGINLIYEQGKFVRFGLSNFTIAQVLEVLEICEKHNFVKPTVYQGQYNALARNPENELLPFLREHQISFYAYAAVAGGAFNRASTHWTAEGAMGDFFRAQYGSATKEIAVVADHAAEHGITGHGLALRWILHHSALSADRGDAILIGARNSKQLNETLLAARAGPLPTKLVEQLEVLWQNVKDTAPPYTIFNPDFQKKYLDRVRTEK